jgi:DMSO/TMAO reductase YedYZ molybdopterin-dependent catalytic subunit
MLPKTTTRNALLVLVIGVLLIAAATIITWLQVSQPENIEWDVTLIGSSGEITLAYDEIKALPPYEGRGGFFTSVGYINGPYQLRGIPILELCDLVGGITSSDIIFISAEDGYSTVLDYQQITGDFITYDPDTMKEVPHGELKLILMYELDNRTPSQEEGRPLRLAIAGEEDLLTEGLYWVKWVKRIEVMPKQNQNAVHN